MRRRRALDASYDTALIAEVVAAKTEVLRAQLDLIPLDAAARTLIALGLARPRRVLDFGGAAGAHYWVARRLVDDLDWHVVETPSIVNAATPTEGLTFHCEVPPGPFDLMFTSGALQYLPDPLGTLRELLAVGAPHMFVTRVAMTDGPTDHVMQRSLLSENGPGPLPAGFADREVCYPMTALPRRDYERVVQEFGYTIRMRLDEGAGLFGLYAVRPPRT